MGKHGIVYGKGVNDMPYGWRSADEWNYRVYEVWRSMIRRCYSKKFHEKNPTYENCYCCERWLFLSNFVEDIVKIDGYELWLSVFGEKINPYQLDKDVKSNGINKCYCLENCMFVTKSENSKQANKTRDNTYLQGRTGGKHGRAVLVDRFDKQGNYIETKYNFEYVEELRINASHISACCVWYACGEDLEEWHKIRKGRPYKSTGGYVFKYHTK